MRRGLRLSLISAILAVAAACGGSGSPTSPANGASGAVPGTPGSGSATITGSIQGGATSAFTAASSGAALSGVTITVMGTGISSMADAGGRFMLMNVPAGTVQLQLSGGGANAAVTIDAVQPAQTVDVVLAVAGTTASLESAVRTGAGEAELEGRVESLPPTMPALTFKAAGRSVRTDSATRFVDGSQSRAFADLQIGMRIHAKGALAGDQFTATLVEMQNSNTATPVEVNGAIDTLTGVASAFSFKIGSRLIRGDAQTSFVGDGDKPDTFADLKEGSRVEVKGEQRDGFAYANRVHVNGPDTGTTSGDGQDASASIQGVLKVLSGAPPNLVLTVDTTTVRTSSSTQVKRKGDFQALDALKTGQTLHVVGVRQSNGSIDARLIEIDDDATGGEFEIEGALGGLKGACPSLTFGVNGFTILTSSSTVFDGATCSALKSGDKVTVKGLKQADGSVAATSVKRK